MDDMSTCPPALFRILRALFPRAFRDAFGEEMEEVFTAQLREATARGVPAVLGLWLRTLTGMSSAAWHERRGSTAPEPRAPSGMRWGVVRHTIRRLAAAPAFTLTAVATMALCMGVNLTIFAAVESILLRPLPFPDSGRLVTIYNTYPRANVMDDGASVANYYERRGRVAAFEALALYKTDAVIVGETGSTEREFVMRVSPEFFSVLGVAPTLGRAFREEDTAPGAGSVVVLTEPYWRQQLSGDRNAVGRTLRVNGTPYVIVGVLPREFAFLSSQARLFLPYVSAAQDRQSVRRHSGSSSQMIARLAGGVSLEEAQSQIDNHNAVFERDNPQRQMIADAGFRSVVVPLHRKYVASIRPVLVLLQAGAIMLLAIGIVNLFLIRAGSRAREFAVRRAIGARGSDIVAAVVGETLLLTVLAAALGVAVAYGGITFLGDLGAARLPLGSRISLNATSIGGAAAVALASGILLGLAVAAWHLRDAAGDALRSGSRAATTGRQAQRTRHAVLVAQIALSFILLAGASLLVGGVRNLMRITPGFRSAQLLTGQVSLPFVRYRTGASVQSFLERLTTAVRATPGISAFGIATNVPLSGNAMKSAAAVVGKPLRRGESPRGVYSYGVAGEYFQAMEIPLIEGRYLTAADAASGARVCVVDEEFARRYWPSGGAIGQRLFPGGTPGAADEAFTVVGVVAAVKQASLAENGRIGAVYYPYSDRFDRAIYLVTRTTLAPDALQADLRRAVRSVDPELPLNNLKSMERRIDDSLVAQRSPAVLASVFSAVALLLTALGTYGVLSYAVSQRRREIGIRIAVGARPAQVQAQFVAVGLRLVAIGLAVGIAGAWASGRVLRAQLPAIPLTPIAALAVAAVVMTLICLAASLLPSRRAAAIVPTEVLARD
jgi:predicted permease